MRQRFRDDKVLKFFLENNIDGKIHYHTSLGRRIRYISIGDEQPATLLFIPGSPASIDLYRDYYKDLQLRDHFKIYAVDRPGYGGSGYGNPEPSIQKQSEMIRPIIDGLHTINRPLIICAGSYGASIACRLLMDHPAIADGLVIDAPSLAPGEEKIFWLVPVIEHSFLRRIIPAHHRTSNTEKIHHEEELKKMLPYWGKINVPVMYIQGKEDKMIFTSNADFARTHLVNVPYLNIHLIPGRKHVIVRKEMTTVKNKIMEMYDLIKNNSGKKVAQR
jgi:uncharacterized protein